MSSLTTPLTIEQLLNDNKELRLRLQETEETLDAIRSGEVDAIIVTGKNGEKVFSITSSETPYRIILEEMDEGAVTVTDNGTILYHNHRFSDLVSHPSEQIAGTNISRFIDPSERTKFNKLLEDSLKGKIRDIVKGGSLYLQLSFFPLPSNIEGAVCIVVSDVTEIKKYQDSLEEMVKERSSELKIANKKLTEDLVRLKRADTELRESEKRFKLLANSIPQMAWIAKSDGRRTWFNKRWYEYTGCTFDQMKGFGWHTVHDPVILPTVIKRWKTAVEEKKPFEMVFPLLGKDGLYREFLTRGIPMRNNKGEIIQWFGTNTDISELKKVEKELETSSKKLSLALENGNIGTWEWHLESNKMNWDQRMHDMLGIDHTHFTFNYPTFEKYINDEDIPHFREAVTETLKHNKPFETVFRTIPVNEESKYISTKAILNKDINAKPVSLNGVCFDITSMKKGSEQVLLKLNEDLMRSNRDLQQFAYVASHDLQEPLRMVSSFTQLLAHRYKDKLDQDAMEFIGYAVDGAKRMYDLLNSLLAYSRVQTGGKEFSRVNMNDVLKKVMQNLTLKIEERQAVVKGEKLPLILADENQMIQLIQNLIENSLKFNTDSPVISISSKIENKYYIFSVNDNGMGIEPQYFERIFQIFQRLLPKGTYEGTGIGLAICKRIIERHKGKIWLESQPGKGSTFYFSIPV